MIAFPAPPSLNDDRSGERMLIRWLVDCALPLWSHYGVDREQGGFHEKLDRSLRPVEEPRRARLVSRQIFCFAIGHELEWSGPAGELIQHGMDFLTTHLLRDDGTVMTSIAADGSRIDGRYDPLDYAFVLLALANAARRLADRKGLHALAVRIRGRLVDGWAHPRGGFRDATLPLKANPQMHLFEAFLAWAEIMGHDDPTWQDFADAMGNLALARMIDPASGALPEFFDTAWRPDDDVRDRLVEPGHQFEWSWLLLRWSWRTGNEAAFTAACRLAEIGETHGVDSGRGVAVNSLDGGFRIRDRQAKLWPQTERIKTWHAIALHPMSRPAERDRAHRFKALAIAGLKPFLIAEPAGLWHEVMLLDGSFPIGPAKASSLYHLSCAAYVLNSTEASAGRPS
jgi:mannose-6-phosphate isomerase